MALDILFMTVPKLEVQGPILAVAQLNGCVKSAGYKSEFLDFNAWFYKQTIDTKMGYIWNVSDTTLIDKDLVLKIERQYTKEINRYYKKYIAPKKPKIIGITVFSYWSFPSIFLVTKVIKEKNPNVKIVLGGPALTTSHDGVVEVIDRLKRMKRIDDFISGDAEISIVKYLEGVKDYPGINNYDFDNNFDRETIPYADYTGIDFSLYKNNPLLYISGSRGCVRNCAFCNVPLLWRKFLWKSGERIANEMIHLYHQHNIKRFRFTDSLINGNQKEFVKMLEVIAKFTEETGVEFKFNGQFIFREIRQTDPTIFSKMIAAGLKTVSVGIESGSEKIRKEIGKPFSNEAVRFHLEEMKKVGLKFTPLMFVGFPTETEEDFQDTLKILEMFAEYPEVVQTVASDHPMIMIPGTPVYINSEDYDIHNITNYFEWESKENDYKKRIERHFIFLNRAIELGLYEKPTVSGKSFNIGRKYLEEYEDQNEEVVKIIKSFTF